MRSYEPKRPDLRVLFDRFLEKTARGRSNSFRRQGSSEAERNDALAGILNFVSGQKEEAAAQRCVIRRTSCGMTCQG